MIVRTRKSGEFYFNKDGNKRKTEARMGSIALEELDEELRDPDF